MQMVNEGDIFFPVYSWHVTRKDIPGPPYFLLPIKKAIYFLSI